MPHKTSGFIPTGFEPASFFQHDGTGDGGAGVDSLADFFAFYGINPNSSEGNIIRQRIEGGEPAGDVFLEFAALLKTGPFVDTGDGGGGAGVSASIAAAQAQRALEENARQFDIAEKNNDRRLMIQLQAQKEALLRGMENDLRTQVLANQESARQQSVELLGKDEARFSASRFGRAAPIHTPADVFKGELEDIATAEIPKLNPNASLDEIGDSIRQLESAAQGSPFRPPGLEHGGTVSKKEVKPFKFGRPEPFTAIDFAEKSGMSSVITGEREGGPELIVGKEFTVIPLTDEEEAALMGKVPGALHGGTVDFPLSEGETISGDVFRSIPNTATPQFFAGADPRLPRLFRSTRDLLAGRGIGGGSSLSSIGQAVRAAGRRPEFAGLPISSPNVALIVAALQREGGSAFGQTQDPSLQFLRNEAFRSSGALRPGEEDAFRELPLLGVSNILGPGTRSFREFAPSFGFVEPEASTGRFQPPQRPGGAVAGVIYSPLTGVLPNPNKVARQLAQIARTDPDLFAQYEDFYALAGYPRATFRQVVQGSGIQGQARGSVGLAA